MHCDKCSNRARVHQAIYRRNRSGHNGVRPGKMPRVQMFNLVRSRSLQHVSDSPFFQSLPFRHKARLIKPARLI